MQHPYDIPGFCSVQVLEKKKKLNKQNKTNIRILNQGYLSLELLIHI